MMNIEIIFTPCQSSALKSFQMIATMEVCYRMVGNSQSVIAARLHLLAVTFTRAMAHEITLKSNLYPRFHKTNE